jgi:hypothetical protein
VHSANRKHEQGKVLTRLDRIDMESDCLPLLNAKSSSLSRLLNDEILEGVTDIPWPLASLW